MTNGSKGGRDRLWAITKFSLGEFCSNMFLWSFRWNMSLIDDKAKQAIHFRTSFGLAQNWPIFAVRGSGKPHIAILAPKSFENLPIHDIFSKFKAQATF